MIEKILISGGWGYRNLGDDAILIATIKLLRKEYPNAHIVVTSYSPEDTKGILYMNNISVVPSIQRIMYGYTMQYGFNASEVWSTFFLLKIHIWRFFHGCKEKIDYALLEKCPSVLKMIISLLYPSIKYHFDGIDLFLMSGGGYLNESHECNISHIIEIVLAKEFGVPIWLIGQTIGPFESERTMRLMSRYLSLADRIVVRDVESKNELEKLGVKVEDKIMPDLAISDVYAPSSDRQYITIIPFFGIKQRMEDIADVVANIAKETGKRVLVTVSQQWTLPEKYAKELTGKLKLKGINVTFVRPANVMELQRLLGASEIVLSQNLHGLIMSYRAGAKIISLNGRRKFQTFVKQVSKDGQCFNIEDFNKNKLQDYCKDMINNKITMNDMSSIIKQITLV